MEEKRALTIGQNKEKFGQSRDNGGQKTEKLGFSRRRRVRFLGDEFDYKNRYALLPFLTERHKIISRRITGLNAKDQRRLTLAIKRARHLAIVPYTVAQVRI